MWVTVMLTCPSRARQAQTGLRKTSADESIGPLDRIIESLRPGLELAQVLRPLLHHLPGIRRVGRAVVGATVEVAHSAGYLLA